ncbi:MAG: ELWxxDGT repeat protein [Planctomycetota bacterium]|jgi:ELWxxDGT repeat protein
MKLAQKLATALGVLSLITTQVSAQSTLTKIDIDPRLVGSSSYPSGSADWKSVEAERFLLVGADAYFMVAPTPGDSIELWKTDGTTPGTQIVTSAVASGDFTAIAEMGGKVYFRGEDANTGRELWVTNGSPGGSNLVVDLRLGSSSSSPSGLTVVGSKLFFGASTTSQGTELCVSDGTAIGTMVLDLAPGPSDSSPSNFLADPQGKGVFFQCSDGSSGAEPWFSDGTAAGTYQLADINPGQASSSPSGMVALGGEVLFVAHSDFNDRRFWRSDGTPGGTVPILSAPTAPYGTDPEYKTQGVHGGFLYFSTVSPQSGESVKSFWKTDGTTAGTQLVWTPGAYQPGPNVEVIGGIGGRLFVSADLGLPGVGRELCMVSPGGLTLVKDLAPGVHYDSQGIPIPSSSYPQAGVVFGSSLLFRTAPESGSSGLWITDGSASGTVLLEQSETTYNWQDQYNHPAESALAPSWLTPLSPNSAVYCGNTLAHGFELHTTDGTPAGTGLLHDINPNQAPLSSGALILGSVGGVDLYLSTRQPAGSGDNNLFCLSAANGLNKLNAAPQSYNQAFDLSAHWVGDHEEVTVTLNSAPSAPGPFTFRTDGTTVGTGPLIALPTGVTKAEVIGSDGKRLFLAVTDAVHGTELWTSDGTDQGTSLLVDINQGSSGSSPHGGVAFDGDLFFIANDGVHGRRLWRSDGTPAGTKVVKDVDATVEFFTIHGVRQTPMQVVGGKLFFVSVDSQGYSLWSSDGTAAGTVQLHLDPNGTTAYTEYTMVPFQNGLCFKVDNHNDALGSAELWTSDGSPGGTKAIQISGSLSRLFLPDQSHASYLFFVIIDSTGNGRLWRFDGVAASLASATIPGPGYSFQGGLAVCGERVYLFKVIDLPTDEYELFVYDIATGVTFPAPGIPPGAPFSLVHGLTLNDGDLFFSARDTLGELELYRYSLPGAHTLDLGYGGSQAKLDVSSPTLGSNVTATVSGAPLGVLGVLTMSAPVSTPSGAHTLPGNALWIDPNAFTILATGMTPSWTVSKQVPVLSGLVGLQTNFQTCFVDPSLPALSTSNGVRVVFGK